MSSANGSQLSSAAVSEAARSLILNSIAHDVEYASLPRKEREMLQRYAGEHGLEFEGDDERSSIGSSSQATGLSGLTGLTGVDFEKLAGEQKLKMGQAWLKTRDKFRESMGQGQEKVTRY